MNLDEYGVRAEVEKYVNTIKTDPVVIDFVKRSQFKSKMNAEKDRELLDCLLGYVTQLAKGFILSNACQTLKIREAITFMQSEDFTKDLADHIEDDIYKHVQEKRNERKEKA